MEIVLYNPNQWQKKVAQDKARFLVLALGRRAGKTTFAVNRLVYKSLLVPGVYWYVTDTYKHAKDIAWIMLKQIVGKLPDGVVGKINESELSIEIGSSLIKLKGCDNADNLVGVGLAGMVIDECALITGFEDIWQIMRPMLTDQKGWCMFISTPRGHNHFYDIYMNRSGLENKQMFSDHAAYNFSSYDNEFLDRDELEEAKSNMHDMKFKQEYLAEFLPQGSFQYFQGVENCIKEINLAPQSGHTYSIGVDLGRMEDSTVMIAVSQQTNEVHGYKSLDNTEWYIQKLEVANFAKDYNNGLIVIDATGGVNSIPEDLRNMNVSVRDMKWTANSKMEIMERLRVYIANGDIAYPKIPKLIHELNKFEFRLDERLKLGTQSEHDDAVAALAMAVVNINRPEVISNAQRIWKR